MRYENELLHNYFIPMKKNHKVSNDWLNMEYIMKEWNNNSITHTAIPQSRLLQHSKIELSVPCVTRLLLQNWQTEQNGVVIIFLLLCIITGFLPLLISIANFSGCQYNDKVEQKITVGFRGSGWKMEQFRDKAKKRNHYRQGGSVGIWKRDFFPLQNREYAIYCNNAIFWVPKLEIWSIVLTSMLSKYRLPCD